ncbi:hypothetical protein DFH07DRAFT_954469 [Mycena maculata]|uniref:Uncharacterized protein n=1 Tax=Mycena maculata TaxID=230809 RepID=A0AAD7NPA9_9AGAR|nr:hypothetical protein DFH07DRAFT_954469 [Mycena maculata]
MAAALLGSPRGVSWAHKPVSALLPLHLPPRDSPSFFSVSHPECGSVALGFSRPEEWPPLFGGPREAWTIHRFWGYLRCQYLVLGLTNSYDRARPQLMRWIVSVHGKYLTHNSRLRLPPGGNASVYVQLCTAFAMSAALHYGAETMAHSHAASLRDPRQECRDAVSRGGICVDVGLVRSGAAGVASAIGARD